MKKTFGTKIPIRMILYLSFTMIGMLAGILLQRYVGLGNVLRSVGMAYPTRAPLAGQGATAALEIPIGHQGQMQLFILVGQSNMVGWAPIPDGEKTDSRIYVFGKDYRWRIADHPIEDASNQVDMVSENRIAGFGSAIDFAIASLERHPDIIIGLIPCAKNSSAIIQWQRNISDQSLYGSCLKRVRAASTMGEISGLLFFQGEEDTLDPMKYPDPEPHAEDWAQLFSKFISDFRKDVGQTNLPVIFAQIGSDPASIDFPNWNLIKEQQASVSLPMTAMITTDDLPLMDGLHFTTDSYVIIGKRFADAYWNLIEELSPK